MPSSFLIIEDHPIFRQALVALLKDAFPESSFVACGTLREGKAILSRNAEAPVIILDLNLPDSHDTEGARELMRLSPALRIVALSADDSQDRRLRLQRLGVRGFLSKSISPDIFIAKLSALIRTGLEESHAPAPPDAPVRYLGLSERQRAVMVEVALGSSNKEIALRLGIGVETVKSHVSEIIRRFGVRNRAEAIRRFLAQEESIEADR